MDSSDPTWLFKKWQQGDQKALSELLPLIYGELHKRAQGLMRGERMDHTLQPSALVNEAYLKLINQKQVPYNSRTHFFRVAARLMRQILVDHARKHCAEKRGGDLYKVPLDDTGGVVDIPVDGPSIDLIALDEALNELAQMGTRHHEVIEMRYFGGLTNEQIADALKISTMTVKRSWTFSKAWLHSRLDDSSGEASAT